MGGGGVSKRKHPNGKCPGGNVRGKTNVNYNILLKRQNVVFHKNIMCNMFEFYYKAVYLCGAIV